MGSIQPEYVDVNGLAELTGISASTWNKRRLTGDSPPFVRVGRSVRYHVPTSRAWLTARQRRSTSDDGSKGAPATMHDAQLPISRAPVSQPALEEQER